jgi:F-type H+-transporting ATPase subunit epsilon
MHLSIITPERTVLESGNARHVLVPAENGELGILEGHMPMVCAMDIGRVRVDLAEESVELATSGGFVEVLADRIVMLAETAEKAEEIDVERARRARDRAEERLRRTEQEIDLARAQAALLRALNRLAVAEGE